MSNSQKTSQFTQLTTLDDAALITITSNGQNFTLPFSALKTDLGVSGTLTATGAALATPVLNNPSANEYEIRSLESGSGILASVSSEDGINIKWNVDQNTTGFTIVDSLTSLKPVLSSLVAGTGMVLSQANDVITITATGEANPTGTIIINSMDDFAIQDATTFTLEAGKIYQYASDISTSKYAIVGDGSKFTANNFFSPTFTYTGTGSMFVGVDASFSIEHCRIDHPNAQGFDFTDTVGNQKLFLMDTVRTISGTKYGTFDNMQTVGLSFSSTLDMDQGVTISGVNMSVLTIDKFFQQSTNAAFIGLDLGSSIALTTEIDDMICVAPAGSIGIKGAANSANVPAGVIATVTGGNFANVTTPLSGITVSDIRWEFIGNSAIPDTRADGLASIITNATETVIASSSTDSSNAVKMAGTWTVEGSSHFTADTTGRITYNGERPFTGPIDVTVNVLMASGSTKNVSAYLDISGTIERATEGKATPTSSLGDSCICHWQHTFTTNDYVEVWLENQSDSVNIIGQSGVLRVN